jgi:PadR family transcriptional regulator PadR
MPVSSTDLLQGTLQILILKALFAEPTHGYGVARWIEQTTEDVLRVEEGSLYPALRRLEDKTFITSDWGTSENNRRARYYSLTPAGRAYLKREVAAWTRYSGAVTRVLRAEPSLV